MRVRNRPPRTMRGQIIAVFLLCLAPITFIALFSSFHAVRVVQEQAIQSNRNTLQLRMEAVDRDLETTSSFLTSFLLDTGVYAKLNAPRDSLARYNAQVSVQNTLYKYLNSYQNTDGLFFYLRTTRDYIPASLKHEDIRARSDIRAFVEEQLARGRLSTEQLEGGWFPQELGGRYYLLRIMELNGAFIGSWVGADNLMIPLEKLQEGPDSLMLLASADNQPLTGQDLLWEKGIAISEALTVQPYMLSKSPYLTVDVPSSTGTFRLLFLVSYRALLSGLDFSTVLLILLAAFSLAGIPIVLVLLWKKILTPLHRVADGMRAVQGGNFDVVLPDHPETAELAAVTDAFNEMTREIHALKIDVYEEQLKRSRAQLQYLNLQIKPHFFLNSLNVIYSLALVKDYRLILEMTSCLMKHFRYMFKSPDATVTIRDELAHVQNYLRILELRYDTDIRPCLEVDPALYDMHLPTLLIHTFVENIIKHAYSQEHAVTLSIRIQKAGPELVELLICDNGPGFPAEALAELNNPDLPDEERETHIGIYNIRQRLRLIYGGRAALRFSNPETGGACVSIRIPMQSEGGIPYASASRG